MKHLTLTTLLTGLLSLSATAAPNIIYILLDDAGYGDFSCYGQKKFSTPNIDRLAAEGIKFTDHYSGSTVCAPTRSVLMTGLHTGHTPSRGNKEIKPVGQFPIPAETFTIAEALKKQGYATAAFGKWGLGFPGSEGDPVNQGFDRFYGYNCQRNAHTYYPTWLFDDKEKTTLDGKTYAHDLITEQSLKWIREHKDGPFFVYLPVTIPHAALHVPEEYAAPFRKKFPQFENVVGKYAGPNIKNPPAMFAGMMTKVDEDTGRLLDLLKELGIDDNTIIMFSSDNGPHQEGGHKPDFFNSSGGFRGHKRDLYEGGIRTAMIARWPGKIAPGTTSKHISAHWDVFPTTCYIAGAPTPDGLDGISFLPTLTGKEQEKHDYLYWEFHERGGKRAVRFGEDGRWKAVQLNLSKKGKDAPIELYDILKDPTEKNNLADKNKDLVAKAIHLFEEAHTENDSFKFKWEQ
jgi:arylsulfatase A